YSIFRKYLKILIQQFQQQFNYLIYMYLKCRNAVGKRWKALEIITKFQHFLQKKSNNLLIFNNVDLLEM
ncbi:hypothetical protein, partial [Flavobacterium sp.]|uniref:hypothetical protein n=1 Tax=Flavobacterium sp. TaxID=239 RepID=UPI0025C627E8